MSVSNIIKVRRVVRCHGRAPHSCAGPESGLLDDLPEMATWQPHRVVTVPAFVGQPDDAFFSNTDEVWERIHSRGWEQVVGVGKVRVEVGERP